MSKYHRAAPDVDFVRGDAEELVVGHRHHREGFVDLPEIDVRGPEVGARQRLLDRVGRGDGELHRIARRVAEVAEPREHRAALALRALLGHEDHCGGAVVDGRGVAGGDGAVLLEGRLEAGNLLRLGELGAFVVGNLGLVSLLVGDLDGHDLGLERALGLGLLRAPGRFHRVLVLCGSGELEVRGAFLAAHAHVHVVVGIPQAIVDHEILELGVAHPRAGAERVREVRRVGHRFHAARDHHVGLAQGDDAGGFDHRLEAGATHLVHRHAGDGLGDARIQCGLARGRLADAALQHLAHEDGLHVVGLDACPLQRGLDGHGSEPRGWNRRKRTQERPDGRAGCAYDHDLLALGCHGCSSRGGRTDS